MTEPRYPYVHVVVSNAEEGELAADALWELGAQGLEERDGSTLNTPEPGGLTLVASFADEGSARAALAALQDEYRAELHFIEGDGWRDAYKAYFKPTRIGQRLVVRPSWEAFEPGPDDVVLTLDPGRAFGTGTHESTRLVLALVQKHVTAGCRVLDVGCGSGILSIAALLFGADSARAIDIDPDAPAVSEENARQNGVGERLVADASPVEAITDTYPLVLANIESRVLVPMVDALCARVQPGGKLIMSGLLASERERMEQVYAGLRLAEAETLGEWLALVFQRPA